MSQISASFPRLFFLSLTPLVLFAVEKGMVSVGPFQKPGGRDYGFSFLFSFMCLEEEEEDEEAKDVH